MVLMRCGLCLTVAPIFGEMTLKCFRGGYGDTDVGYNVQPYKKSQTENVSTVPSSLQFYDFHFHITIGLVDALP